VAEERNTEQDDNGQERPSRPVTAAARRERRAAARPAAKKDAATDAKTDSEAKSAPKGKTTDRPTRRAAKAEPSRAADAKGRPTRARDSQVTRVGFISRIGRFLREVVAELRKVIWPTRKQMITYTSVVLVFLAVMVALIWAFDFALIKGALKLFG
jgi:preprotein translocase subunit SecE